MTKLTHKPFAGLGPEQVLQALENYGFETDGRLFALNSYENRVYQVGFPGGWWVAKFYRPDRWSDTTILEEHDFARELAESDLEVAVPIAREDETLFHESISADSITHHDVTFRFSVFPFLAARSIEIDSEASLELIGRSVGRLHAVGARDRFTHRPTLSVDRLGWQARDKVLNSRIFTRELADPNLEDKYTEASESVLSAVATRFDLLAPLSRIRLHGDCHLGNLLLNAKGPLFVDLDDCMTGPRMQDLWMLLSGSEETQRAQWQSVLRGYQQFHDIDPAEFDLIEALRALRMVHQAGWIAERWEDPAFPRAFPWFTSPRYWQDHIADLWQQCEQVGG